MALFQGNELCDGSDDVGHNAMLHFLKTPGVPALLTFLQGTHQGIVSDTIGHYAMLVHRLEV